MEIRIVEKSIVEADTKYIAHQCNCITKRSAGTAAAIYKSFPYSNIYKDRPDGFIDSPGKIVISGNGEDQRFVINMLAQVYPGKPKYPDSKLDGTKAREIYFIDCIKQIANIENLTSIAFPYKIGCNLGGGQWENYLYFIQQFAKMVEGTAEVVIYKLPELEKDK